MYTFDDLVGIIAKLRSPEGCPWDREQTFESLKKCLADETEEVFQAATKVEASGGKLFALLQSSIRPPRSRVP